VASGKKSNPYATRLAKLAKTIAKTRPEKLHPPLFGVFVVVAAAGDVPRARRVLEWMYGSRLPVPTAVATALSTAAMDGFCAAAGLGDLTKGIPRRGPTAATFAERVAEGALTGLERLTRNAYLGDAPADDTWETKPATDPWRRIDQWRRIQRLVTENQERAALDRLDELLGDLGPEARGAGYGDEIVLALLLALRNGESARVAGWVGRHGHRFERESFLIETARAFRKSLG
jgi:hypothetical protein